MKDFVNMESILNQSTYSKFKHSVVDVSKGCLLRSRLVIHLQGGADTKSRDPHLTGET